MCNYSSEIVKCPDLYDPSYGSVNMTDNKPGSTAHYECDYGFKLVGNEYRECLYNGYWSGKEPICKSKDTCFLCRICGSRSVIKFFMIEIIIITCPDLYDPSYGSVNMTDNTPGSTAHYECDYGFKLVGDAYRECLYNGYWSGKEPVCKRK